MLWVLALVWVLVLRWLLALVWLPVLLWVLALVWVPAGVIVMTMDLQPLLLQADLPPFP